jgi:hypothetical protein
MVRRVLCVSLVLLSFVAGVGSLPRTSPRHATAATPVPSASGTLEAMLRLAPDVLAGSAPPQTQIAGYADAAAQLASLGVTAPEAFEADDPATRAWIGAAYWLMFPSFMIGKTEFWRETFGFDLLQVDQSLEIGEPPSAIAILRGRFDVDAITTALTRAGYQTVAAEGATVYSLDPEDRVVFSSDAGRLALARMNNIAILPDGTLICASRLDLVQQTLAVAQGTAPSLADRPDVQSLLAAQDAPLASALLVMGTALASSTVPDVIVIGTPVDVDVLATRIAEIGEMPPVIMALLGVTAGGPVPPPYDEPASGDVALTEAPDAHFAIALLMPDAASAETAVRVATERLATGVSGVDGRPFSAFFADWQASVVPETSVAKLELTFAEGVSPGVWIQLFARRDLLFLAW